MSRQPSPSHRDRSSVTELQVLFITSAQFAKKHPFRLKLFNDTITSLEQNTIRHEFSTTALTRCDQIQKLTGTPGNPRTAAKSSESHGDRWKFCVESVCTTSTATRCTALSVNSRILAHIFCNYAFVLDRIIYFFARIQLNSDDLRWSVIINPGQFTLYLWTMFRHLPILGFKFKH